MFFSKNPHSIFSQRDDDERFVSTARARASAAAATTQQMDGEGGAVSDMRDDECLVLNENVYQSEPLSRQDQSSASYVYPRRSRRSRRAAANAPRVRSIDSLLLKRRSVHDEVERHLGLVIPLAPVSYTHLTLPTKRIV